MYSTGVSMMLHHIIIKLTANYLNFILHEPNGEIVFFYMKSFLLYEVCVCVCEMRGHSAWSSLDSEHGGPASPQFFHI